MPQPAAPLAWLSQPWVKKQLTAHPMPWVWLGPLDALATLIHRQLRAVCPLPASCVQDCSSSWIPGLCILPNISEAAPPFITAMDQDIHLSRCAPMHLCLTQPVRPSDSTATCVLPVPWRRGIQVLVCAMPQHTVYVSGQQGVALGASCVPMPHTHTTWVSGQQGAGSTLSPSGLLPQHSLTGILQ